MQKLEIRLIEVDGSYKALVMDMAKSENRLVYIASNSDADLAYNDAECFVKTQALTWH